MTFFPATCQCRPLAQIQRRCSHTFDKHRSSKGWWHNFDKYIVSLLKSYYGDRATKSNEFGFNYLPRITGDHSELGYWLDMQDGKMEGLFVIGQNPAVGAPNARLQRTALSKLKWLVVRDMVEIKQLPSGKILPKLSGVSSNPRTIATEVFFLPRQAMRKKKAPSPIRNACSSSMKRRSIRPATAAVRHGSFITLGVGSKREQQKLLRAAMKV